MMKPMTNAPKTVKGMAIMNNTLKLKARPNELFNALAQLGQACATSGLISTNALITKVIVGIFLCMGLPTVSTTSETLTIRAS